MRSPTANNGSRTGVSSRPIHTMNILLGIGVLLQLFQIYRTTPFAVDSSGVAAKGSTAAAAAGLSMESPRDLQASFGMVPKKEKEGELSLSPAEKAFYGEKSSSETEIQRQKHQEQWEHLQYLQEQMARQARQRRYVNLQQQQEHQTKDDWNPGTSNSKQQNSEQVLKDRNMILYGNEDGMAKQPIFRDDDDPTEEFQSEYNSTLPKREPTFLRSRYNYSLPAQRTDYTLPTQPQPTNASNVVVIVLSARANFERRQVIRETWAKNLHNIFFVLGGPDPESSPDMDMSNPNSTSIRLFREQETYQDMLDTVHPDTYKGLPYKLHYAIKWIGRYEHIQWVLKADDDVVVRLRTLQYYVLRKYNPTTPMVIGRMEPNSAPHARGKWAEDPKMTMETYPPWAYGSSGYVMSRGVIDYIASEQSIYYYQGEDVSLGLWLYESPLDVTWIDSPDFNLQKDQLWYNHKYSVVIGHDLTVEEIREFYDKWKDPQPLMEIQHANHTEVNGLIFYDRLGKLEDEEHMFDENAMGDDTWFNDRHPLEGDNSYYWESLSGSVNNTQYAYNEMGERVDIVGER